MNAFDIIVIEIKNVQAKWCNTDMLKELFLIKDKCFKEIKLLRNKNYQLISANVKKCKTEKEIASIVLEKYKYKKTDII